LLIVKINHSQLTGLLQAASLGRFEQPWKQQKAIHINGLNLNESQTLRRKSLTKARVTQRLRKIKIFMASMASHG